MRSGKHRRPRQAPALLVAAGVTGSAIAIPLLGAASAGAADATTWDRVAECESGGQWSASLGSGHYGGLQMSQETWDRFGGADYAASPDLASRSQQIAVAEKVFAAQGPLAWPSCAAVSGLAKSVVSGVAGGDRGAGAEAGSPEAPAATPGTSDSAAGEKGKDTEPAPSASPASPAPGEDATDKDGAKGPTGDKAADSAPAKGKHRGAAAKEEAGPEAPAPDREPDSRASRDGADRGTDSLTDGGVTHPTESRAESVVVGGETLSGIIGAQKVVGGWV
ncbi:transglycosylase family protein [Streptomyces sp. NPDC087850]|uniref:transglycosylase family protein n=1 Tax=Streptomyces sp. NPDC087850 TaxID=3365809 RepID=UPI0037FC9199